jgi:Cell Wall Hydrolase
MSCFFLTLFIPMSGRRVKENRVYRFNICIMALVAWGWASVAVAQGTLWNTIPYTPPSAAERDLLVQDAARLLQNPPVTLEGETDLACMAVAVYHESRGESIQGQRAVASVVLQRTLVPDRWGSRPCDVVRPVQFTFMTGRWTYAPIRQADAWETALRVALTILYKGPDPELQGADHYHTHQVFPEWRNAMDLTTLIGNHRFYVDPLSVKKVAEAGIGTQAPLMLAGAFDWSGQGTPTYTVGDGVRGMPQGVVQDLYSDGWAEAKQQPATQPHTGGFEPVRGPDVDAIALAQQGVRQGHTVGLEAQQPVGRTMGLASNGAIQPVDVAQSSFRPLGFGAANP